MKILLVRHGETQFNHLKLIQGITDNPLNETGINQAHQVGKYLKNSGFTFDVAYSSPLKRAYKTGKIIVSYFDYSKQIIIDDLFKERNFGPFEGKPVQSIIHKILEGGFEHDGFEDDQSLTKRVFSGIEKLYSKHSNETVILFCHSHVIKPLLILADPINYNYKTFLDNGSSHLFEFDGKNIKILKFNIT